MSGFLSEREGIRVILRCCYYLAIYDDAGFSVSSIAGPSHNVTLALHVLAYLPNEARWARGVYRRGDAYCSHVSGWDPRDPTSGSVCGAETVMNGVCEEHLPEED